MRNSKMTKIFNKRIGKYEEIIDKAIENREEHIIVERETMLRGVVELAQDLGIKVDPDYMNDMHERNRAIVKKIMFDRFKDTIDNPNVVKIEADDPEEAKQKLREAFEEIMKKAEDYIDEGAEEDDEDNA